MCPVWRRSQQAQSVGVVGEARRHDGRESMVGCPIQGRLEKPPTDLMPLKLVTHTNAELQLPLTGIGEAQVANYSALATHLGERDEALIVHVIESAEGTGNDVADATCVAEKARSEAVWGQPRIERTQLVAV
jgi:hypothetical protein